jgi:hypothetical protein
MGLTEMPFGFPSLPKKSCWGPSNTTLLAPKLQYSALVIASPRLAYDPHPTLCGVVGFEDPLPHVLDTPVIIYKRKMVIHS